MIIFENPVDSKLYKISNLASIMYQLTAERQGFRHQELIRVHEKRKNIKSPIGKPILAFSPKSMKFEMTIFTFLKY